MTNPRCLYSASIQEFIQTNTHQVLGILHAAYHGDALAHSPVLWRQRIAMVSTWKTTQQGDPSWALILKVIILIAADHAGLPALGGVLVYLFTSKI